MNANVSEMTETKIREIARHCGQDAADLAGTLLEEKVNGMPNPKRKLKKLSDLAAMFNGGNTDTGERADEIMRAEIDKYSGFGK